MKRYSQYIYIHIRNLRRLALKYYRAILRHPVKAKCRKTPVKETTIISSNCIGGIIYNTFGMEFLSPTINLFIVPHDFIIFVNHLDAFLHSDDFELITSEPHIMVKLSANGQSIMLHCIHYKSFEEVTSLWKRRAKRVVSDRICVIMTERDGCTYADLQEFDKIKYQKVCFVHKPMPEFDWAVYLDHTEVQNDVEHKVVDLTQYENWHSGRRIIDRFDYTNFLCQMN